MLEVRAGGAPMNGRIAKMVLRQFAQQPPPRPDYGLTLREQEILEALVRGLTKKEIAAELHLSVHTADFHLRHIYEKLHVNTRTGAVAKAIRERLT
jgi:DNA-binding NarL/FixJ family response regulator